MLLSEHLRSLDVTCIREYRCSKCGNVLAPKLTYSNINSFKGACPVCNSYIKYVPYDEIRLKTKEIV